MTIWKALSWLAKGLAYLWLLLLVVGLFGKLFVFIGDLGLVSGYRAWIDWFDPRNPINIAVRVIEALPAIGLLWIGDWLSKRPHRQGQKPAPM